MNLSYNYKLKCIFKYHEFNYIFFYLCIFVSRCTLRFPSTSICIKVQQCLSLTAKHFSMKKNISMHAKFKRIFLDYPEMIVNSLDNEKNNEDIDLDCNLDDVLSFKSVRFNEHSSRTRRKQSLIPCDQIMIDERFNEFSSVFCHSQ